MISSIVCGLCLKNNIPTLFYNFSTPMEHVKEISNHEQIYLFTSFLVLFIIFVIFTDFLIFLNA